MDPMFIRQYMPLEFLLWCVKDKCTTIHWFEIFKTLTTMITEAIGSVPNEMLHNTWYVTDYYLNVQLRTNKSCQGFV